MSTFEPNKTLQQTIVTITVQHTGVEDFATTCRCMNKRFNCTFEAVRNNMNLLSVESFRKCSDITFGNGLKQKHHGLCPLEYTPHDLAIDFFCPCRTPHFFRVILQPPWIPKIEYVRNSCGH